MKIPSRMRRTHPVNEIIYVNLPFKSMQETQFTVQDESLAIRYLLGQLKGGKKRRFEERYFEDEEFFEHVCAVEEALIDEFLQNRLSWWKRRRFKKAYWSTPEHRKKVAAAQEMMRAFASERRPSFWRSVAELVRAQNHRTQMAVAFFAIAVVLGPWVIYGILLFAHRPLNRSLPLRQLSAGTPASRVTSATLASFLLEPGVSRGSAEGRHRLIIPRNADLVSIELALPARGSGQQYRVRLLIAGGIEIWREDFLPAHQTASGPLVAIWLPTEFLTHTDYVFIVELERPIGRFPEIASYQFALIKQ